MSTTATPERTTVLTHWSVDTDRSSVEFAVKSFWGLATVRGRFGRFEGSYDAGAEEATIELTVDADSVDTGNQTRDKHLRSDGFFHVAEHPRLHFTSERVHPVREGISHVGGQLEVVGKRMLLEFPATVEPVEDGLEIEATTTVDQEELGMSSGTLGMIRRPATVHVKAHLTETPVDE
jgi:polyisoprenoid-binding protein YceI